MTSSSSAGVPDLRERRRLQTYASISDVAIELFERSGVDGTTVEQIADAAGVSPRTFFRYFRTKEDAALTSYIAFADRITSWLENETGEDLVVSLESAIEQAMEQIDADVQVRERLLRVRRLLEREPALHSAAAQSDASSVAEFARRLMRKPHSSLSESEALLISSLTVTIATIAMQEWAAHVDAGGADSTLAAAYARVRRSAHRHFGRAG
ncbi:TetR family transcriptional regulator [Microbacterium sp. ZW T5_45]|uniref:TetR family transcriptional regulator n=1 Tax=Microbacterium sp. ZW T5_45 TaxID=3378080 RepID=UPI003851D187